MQNEGGRQGLTFLGNKLSASYIAIFPLGWCTEALASCCASFPAGPIPRKGSGREEQQSGSLGPEGTGAGTCNHRNRCPQCDEDRQCDSADEIRSPRNAASHESAEEGKGKTISHGECFETKCGGRVRIDVR